MLLVEIAFALPFVVVGAAYAYSEWSRRDWEEHVAPMAVEVSFEWLEEVLG